MKIRLLGSALVGSALVGSALAMAVIGQPATAQIAGTPDAAITFPTQQPADEWMGSLFIGAAVTNADNDTVGDISDILFDKNGRITSAVLGVGGFLGVGEKLVAVPFNALTLKSGANGEHIVQLAISRDQLARAPAFVQTEKTSLMKAREKAGEIADQAKKKLDEMIDSTNRK